MEPIVSIIIPTYKREEKLQRLLKSIYLSKYPKSKLEVIVVNNNPEDSNLGNLEKTFSGIKILKQAVNQYSAGGRNIGALNSKGEIIFFIDDDNVLEEKCIPNIVRALNENPEIGVVGPLMLYFQEKNLIWCAGGKLNWLGIPFHLFVRKDVSELPFNHLIRNIDYLPNAYAIRGGIKNMEITHDVLHFPHNWAEQDFCERVKKAGYQIATITSAITYHDIDYTNKVTRISLQTVYDQARSRIFFRRRYFNNFHSWFFFFLLIFPVSTFHYMKEFALRGSFFSLSKLYFEGTFDGFKLA